jgi:hypothetical protein
MEKQWWVTPQVHRHVQGDRLHNWEILVIQETNIL